MNTGLRRAAVSMMAVAIVMGLSSVAQTSAAPVRAPELVPLMVVLDASGSMQPQGKMASAKNAVRMLAEQAPEGASMGLAVYGSGTGNTPAEKPRGCKDVKVLHKPGTSDPGALAQSVNGIEPRGYTPIGESLRTAAAQLPAGKPGAIVLVSDGEDTCAPPDPCQVAKDLAEDGTDLKVHSVGFNVDEKAERQLTCIAQATGGTFSAAPDGDDLARVLPRVTRQALRNYDTAGKPINGGSDTSSAPPAGPGLHLDQIGENESKYYAIDVPKGYTARATATAVYNDEGGTSDTEKLSARVLDRGGKRCRGRYTFTRKDLRVGSAHRTWKPTGSMGGSCSEPGKFHFKVERRKLSGGVDGPVPVELMVMLEPPVGEGGKGAERGDRVSFQQPGGPPEEAVGGGSFNTAALLNGSGQYTDTLLPGETIFYRVDLDWGQAMAHRVRLPAGPPADLTTQTFSFGPNRSMLYKSGNDPYRGEATQIEPSRTLRPVRYLNRDLMSTIGADDEQAIPGAYYIAVQLADPRGASGAPVPVNLDVSVQGKAEQGPAYVGGGIRDGRTSPAPAADDEESSSLVSGAGPLLWVGAPVLLLAIAAPLVYLWLQRRRSPAPAAPFPGPP
ncbi:VWA domain-containing protein, partial [Actinomadura sp. 7K507]|uniref:vWA domain-containing protein n=1 Tax=Actinomadura sp. 7K507 TaxID=2530365 RepID=UPI00104C76AA